MYRFFILLFAWFVVQETAVAQAPGNLRLDTAISPGKKEFRQQRLSDTALYNRLVNTLGDSLVNAIDSLLKDSTFIRLLGGVNSLEYAQFVSQFSKDYFPAKQPGWTNDYENIFTSEQVAELDSVIRAFENETTIEIAVVTLHRSWTTKDRFDSLVLAIHNAWGVGKMNINNGIVIGISTGLRQIRISNGYGIVPLLSDEETKAIIDEAMIPAYKQGNYFEGTMNGLLALIQKIRKQLDKN